MGLINTFLTSKEGSFAKFCEVLLAVEGQRHIVTDIFKLHVRLAAIHPVQVGTVFQNRCPQPTAVQKGKY